MSSSTPDQDAPAPDGAAADAPAHDAEAPSEHPATSPAEPSAAEAGGAARGAGPEGADDGQEPQDVTLLVDPDRVRRAPKYPVFLWMGALVGAVVGLIFSTWLIDVSGSAETLMKPGVYVSVTILGGIALGLGVGGLIAVISDRRSLRRR
ncbi:hypothetical protein AAG589_15520 [Isoptericola sp. F-RaC21]|uniref:hypothetical protein n=1 Tax=Isoptericola sp. F-RaC21 TaxID=3141452 RepID=UPI00315C1CA7